MKTYIVVYTSVGKLSDMPVGREFDMEEKEAQHYLKLGLIKEKPAEPEPEPEPEEEDDEEQEESTS